MEDETFGTRTVIPLIEGGDSTPVRNDNKMHYILMLADWHLNVRLGTAAAAFAKGMQKASPVQQIYDSGKHSMEGHDSIISADPECPRRLLRQNLSGCFSPFSADKDLC